jgi:hypothetical protein
MYILTIITSIVFIAFGEFMRVLLSGILGSNIVLAFSTALMLSLSYISLFAILTYVLLISSASGGKLSFTSLGAGLISVWVVITILKANYVTWTIGWWSAEVIMIMSIVVFTLILVRLFIVDSIGATKRQREAIAFSSFLSELISRHQITAIDSLNEISMDITTDDTALGSISNAMSNISRANELSKRIEMFVSGHAFEESQLGHVSLRDSILSALECAGLSSTSDSIQIAEGAKSIELMMEQDCSIRGNAFLIDAFQYLLLGIMNRIGYFDSVTIKIREPDESIRLCICEINLDVIAEDSLNALELLRRYVERGSVDAAEMAYSQRIIDLFGGSMTLQATQSGEKGIEIVITIQLVKA